MKNFLLVILLVDLFFLQCTNTVRLNGTKKYYTKEWIKIRVPCSFFHFVEFYGPWSLVFDPWEGEGNGIVSCGWLHNGIKHEIQIDKVIPAPGSEPATLSEKITRQNYCPSLVELGGCPISGVFGITSHGEFVLKVFNEFEPTKSTLVKVCRFRSNLNPLYLWFLEIIDVTALELFPC